MAANNRLFGVRVCCLYFLAWWCPAKGLNSTAHGELLQKLRGPEYIASVRPPSEKGGDPIIVEVDLLFNSLGPVNVTDMTWTASFYLREEWTDSRLRLEGRPDSRVKLHDESVSGLWQPDIFFSNGKQGLRHYLTVPNRVIYIHTGTGLVLTSQRLTMTLNCEMNLVKFPHDHQTCRIVMESYGYKTDDMVLRWSSKRDATELYPTVFLLDFGILSITTLDCAKTYATGTFPCLEVEVKMQRKIGYYVIQTFLPTILIVILSWASFWIDHEAAPARVSVGLLTVLTITTQLVGSTAVLPKVPYIKAIDLWMSMNLVFVVAAYMEYPMVTALSRRHRKADQRNGRRLAEKYAENSTESRSMTTTSTPNLPQPDDQCNTAPKLQNSTAPNSASTTSRTSTTTTAQSARKPSSRCAPCLDGFDPGRQLDKKARVLFPLGFAIFNIVYWTYYMA